MATPAQRTNTWILDEWYDQAVAETTGGYNAMDPYGLFMWGKNATGELGINVGYSPSQQTRSSPTQIPGSTWNNVGNGRGSVTIGVKSDSTLWAWGNNGDGALGQNNNTNFSSPTQIGTGADWKHMGVGENHGVCTKTDGTIWAWGKNGDGNLGQNNVSYFSSPRQIPGTTWDKAFANGESCQAIKTDGTLWVWGGMGYGGLGTNNQTQYSSPIQIGTETTWNELVCSSKGWIATKTDGTLWMTGNNEFGALGKNTTNDHQSSPIQIGTGTDWSLDGNAINSNTQGQSYAIKTDGTMWVWGYNANGQLGDNSRTNLSSPTQVPGTTWKNIASSYYTTTAVKTDGTLWSWGYNGWGALGLNQPQPTRRSSPTQIGTATNWFGCQGSSDYNFVAYTPS